MKKRIILATFCCVILSLLTGCGNPSAAGDKGINSVDNILENKDDNEISIVSTIFPPYDFTREVIGDYASVTQLLPVGAESHTYEPTPRDIVLIQNCDLFIYAGGESDTWIEEILSSVDTKQVRLLSMMDCVESVEEEIVPGMQEESGPKEEKELDEHVWTAPQNAIMITEKITEELAEIDSGHAADYRANAAAYIEKLQNLDYEYRQAVKDGKRKTIVVGDRFPFRYLADAYGLSYFAAFPGCSEDAEPSASTIAFLINKVNEERIPVVFHIEFSNEKVADSICESTGAKSLLLHSCHNVSEGEMNAGVTYLDLMEQNLANLKEALR